MSSNKYKKYSIYYNFLNKLAKDLSSFYFKKINKNFSVSNKLKGKGYDPVTTSDKAFEKFIRLKISHKFPGHQIIGEEFGHKKAKSDYSWIIDPIDGTRSYVIGNPTWSNLISLNYKGYPILGLANFPMLNKYYLNYNDKISYVFENGKKRRIRVNKKVSFNHAKVSGAFHGFLSLKKQQKIPKVLKIMRFKCPDALSYVLLAEGRIDIVIQCANKIWDIHPIIPIVKAAGGTLSTWDNKDAFHGGSILVSGNSNNHKKMLKLLKPVAK
jgi:myo-inositol-1(or 4)-monophosphatase|tara:strand:+ start:887 stop:1693 length:807 start_codon:yes stop_codon:yes gene_type:complete